VLKIFQSWIQYFDREKGALQTKVLNVQSKPNKTTQTVAQDVHWTLCNNVFANLKDSVKTS
jgi:hypothetical protein